MLRIVTWNLWWRFGPWRERQPAIATTLAAVDADIIALQEVWSDGATDQAAKLAAGLGFHHVYAEAMTLDGFGQGNAILSRRPILQSAAQTLSGAEKTGETRLVLFAEIDAPGGPLPVFTTHLNWRPSQGAVRFGQVGDIARFIQARRSPGRPVILCGDFNATPDSDEIALLTGPTGRTVEGLVFEDAWAAAGDGGAGITFDQANPHAIAELSPGRRIDYVFLGRPEGGACRIADCRIAGDGPVDGVWPSDHYAVVAELAL
ncbi:MAG TPA: endonuclease/exonuclease/phosphatase family protein [Afifellaceae bacterium]|nr:endonuclease/exonuclease/phosphatase family protein [Afifellaceae bacterium]